MPSLTNQTSTQSLRVGELLDESLVADESIGAKDEGSKYQIKQSGKTWDLSKLDFEKLQEEFHAAPHENIEIADLRAFIQKKVDQMLKQNATRVDFATRLQAIIDRYNSGSSLTDNYFTELVKFIQELQTEAARHVLEGLTEDELELFDLIKKDKMTKRRPKKSASPPSRCSIALETNRRKSWYRIGSKTAKAAKPSAPPSKSF
jgi:type I restriction enzyme R subunit